MILSYSKLFLWLRLGGSLWNRDTYFWGPISSRKIIIDISQSKHFQATLRWKTRRTWLWPPTPRSTARRRRSSCGRWPPAKWGEPSSAESQTPSETVSTRWEKSTTQKNLLSLTAFCHSFVRSAHAHLDIILQEYFTSSGTYPEGLNGSGYYGNLPVQQAHSTTPHEAPHSVSVTAGGPPGGPPTGALDNETFVY